MHSDFFINPIRALLCTQSFPVTFTTCAEALQVATSAPVQVPLERKKDWVMRLHRTNSNQDSVANEKRTMEKIEFRRTQ